MCINMYEILAIRNLINIKKIFTVAIFILSNNHLSLVMFLFSVAVTPAEIIVFLVVNYFLS